MIKYFVYAAECNDIGAIEIFKVDIEKDLYLENIPDPFYGVGEVQVEKMLKNDDNLYGRPSDNYYFERNCFDTLEEALRRRHELVTG